jgi:hypothetical protein
MKNAKRVLTKILYVLFIIGTVGSIIIVYKQINYSIASRFLMLYLYLALFMVIFISAITISNMKQLKAAVLNKRSLKFIALFASFSFLNYGMDYFLRPSNIDLLRELSIALGLAFGLLFTDMIFNREKEI